jgi:hypothetical protein
MLSGTLRKRDNAWFVDYASTLYSEPSRQTISWKVTGARRSGNCAFAPEMADRLAVTSVPDRDAWQAYKDGGYLVLETEHEGESVVAPYPCPKVRRGIETRYRYGQWEKRLKTGWTPITEGA